MKELRVEFYIRRKLKFLFPLKTGNLFFLLYSAAFLYVTGREKVESMILGLESIIGSQLFLFSAIVGSLILGATILAFAGSIKQVIAYVGYNPKNYENRIALACWIAWFVFCRILGYGWGNSLVGGYILYLLAGITSMLVMGVLSSKRRQLPATIKKAIKEALKKDV
ncbi:MAG: hypothetical protein FWC79_02335 [Oscillospiraceae bacterium]|nr:hypothetical protein [Oscillospiraceae bacterium]